MMLYYGVVNALRTYYQENFTRKRKDPNEVIPITDSK